MLTHPALLFFFFKGSAAPRDLPSSPPRRSPDLVEPMGTDVADGAQLAAAPGLQPPVPVRGAQQPVLEIRAVDVPDLAERALLHERARSGTSTDRKSTRLNSSHGYISYAVFCLKK